MALFLPRRWRSQPVGFVGVNQSHPLASRVSALLLPINNTFYDVVRRQAWTVVGTPGAGRNATGSAVVSLGTGDYWQGPNGDLLLPRDNAATFAIVYRKYDSTARNATLFTTNDPSGVANTRFSSHAPYVDGTTYLDFGGTGAGNRVSAAGIDYTTRPVCAVSTAGSNGVHLYNDGVVKATSSTAVTRTLGSSGAFTINQWPTSSTTPGDLIEVYGAAVLNASLTAEQARVLSLEFWNLWAPARRVVYFAPAAAGSSFKSAWARNSNVIIGAQQ